MTTKWEVTEEAFTRFLTWLDPDRVNAGEKYEDIRRRLIAIFISRGCPDAEELADEVINRVIRRAQEMADTYEGDPLPYFITVAHHLHQEYAKSRRRFTELPADLPTPAEPEQDKDRKDQCLEQCMQQLTPENRNLVLEFYRKTKQAKIDYRKKLAQDIGISLNALRIRVHRIRGTLERCVEPCIGGGSEIN